MRGRLHQLGVLVPGDSALHRAPLAVKYAGVLVTGAAALIWRSPAVTLPLLALTVILYAWAGRRVLTRWPWPLTRLWWVFAILGTYQWWLAGHDAPAVWVAAGVIGGMLTALQAARLLLLTTEQSLLLDGLFWALRPLRHLGVDPESLAIAIHVMLRSIPALAGSVGDVTEAAAARGLKPNPVTLAGPVVISTVGYAHRTADALAARGLLDGDRADPASTNPTGPEPRPIP